MPPKIGGSVRDMKDEDVYGERSDVIRMSQIAIGKPLQVRIVQLPVAHAQVWYPCLREDSEQRGRWKESMATINVDPKASSNYFTALATIDRQIQARMGGSNVEIDKLQSKFDPTLKYVMGAIPRNWEQDKGLRLVMVEISRGLFRKIIDMQEAVAPDPTYLLNGPVILYDVILSAYNDPSQPASAPDYQKRRYNEPKPWQNAWQGKCPISWAISLPEDFDYVAQGVFTPEEWGHISENLIDLDTLRRPMTTTEIEAQLTKFPINLWATKNNVPLFPHARDLQNELMKLRVDALPEDEVSARLGTHRKLVGAPEPQKPVTDAGSPAALAPDPKPVAQPTSAPVEQKAESDGNATEQKWG